MYTMCDQHATLCHEATLQLSNCANQGYSLSHVCIMESFYQASHQATGGRVPIFHHIFPTTLANSSTILKILVLAVEFEIFQKLKGCIIAHLKDHTVDLFFLYTILQKHYNGLQKPQEMLEL